MGLYAYLTNKCMPYEYLYISTINIFYFCYRVCSSSIHRIFTIRNYCSHILHELGEASHKSCKYHFIFYFGNETFTNILFLLFTLSE